VLRVVFGVSGYCHFEYYLQRWSCGVLLASFLIAGRYLRGRTRARMRCVALLANITSATGHLRCDIVLLVAYAAIWSCCPHTLRSGAAASWSCCPHTLRSGAAASWSCCSPMRCNVELLDVGVKF